MNRIGILITARLSSTRLFKKHLQQVNGQPILQYLINRITYAFKSEIDLGQVVVVVVTGDKKSNAELIKALNCISFYGDAENVPLRHLQTAYRFNLNAIISVDGDDVLCSTEAMREVYDRLRSGSSYVKTVGLPFGMNVCGYSTNFLTYSLDCVKSQTLQVGWNRIFTVQDPNDIIHFKFEEDNRLRFTLDYEEDLYLLRQIIMRLPDYLTATDADVINLVLYYQLYQINANVVQAYWRNFNEEQNKEVNANGTR
jgi:spore coat polysaccharide biosynthesis protein SpsF (cytidylyltransferase family)